MRLRGVWRRWSETFAVVAAYRVDLHAGAERDLERLAPVLLARVLSRLHALATDPRPPGAEKLAAQEGYRVRVGNWRIAYEIDDPTRRVLIRRFRHRRDVYRRL